MKRDDDEKRNLPTAQSKTTAGSIAASAVGVLKGLTQPSRTRNSIKLAELQAKENDTYNVLGQSMKRLEETKEELRHLEVIRETVALDVAAKNLEAKDRVLQAQRAIDLHGLDDGIELRRKKATLLHGNRVVDEVRNPPEPPPEPEPESAVDKLERRAREEEEIDEWMLQKFAEIDERIERGLQHAEGVRQKRNIEDAAKQAKRQL